MFNRMAVKYVPKALAHWIAYGKKEKTPSHSIGPRRFGRPNFGVRTAMASSVGPK